MEESHYANLLHGIFPKLLSIGIRISSSREEKMHGMTVMKKDGRRNGILSMRPSAIPDASRHPIFPLGPDAGRKRNPASSGFS